MNLERQMLRKLAIRMREEAKKESGFRGSRKTYGKWSFVLSFITRKEAEAFNAMVVCDLLTSSSTDPSWHFSAKLLPNVSSDVHDWEVLGWMAAAVGAPEKPMVPVENLPPTATIHWHWTEPE